MKEPDPAYERRILLDVVEQMRDPEETGRKQAMLRRTVLGLGSTGLVVVFFLAMNRLVHPFTVGFLAAAAGTATGFGLFLDFVQKQWPVTRRHIDMNSVRRRIEELGN